MINRRVSLTMKCPREKLISRDLALTYGVECYSYLHRACVELRDGGFAFGNHKIYWTEVLQRVIALNFADALQQLRHTTPINPKRRLYFWKQKLNWLFEGLIRQQQCKRTIPRKNDADEVFFAPKVDNHLRDMLSVSRVLKEKYFVRTNWLLLNSRHAKDITEDEIIFPCVINLKEWCEEKRRMISALRQIMKLMQLETPPLFVNKQEWSKLLGRVLINIRLQVDYLTMAALFIKSLLESSRVKTVLIGNPYVSEGRLLVAAAQGYGVRCAFMQHGMVDAQDPLQLALPSVNKVFVWSTQSRDAFLQCGYKEDQVVVSGAAWLDNFTLPRDWRNNSGKRTVLVALSGAGHSVGLDEHKRIVERIYLASKNLSQVHFVFRLHTKDDAKIHQEVASHTGNPTCEIIKSSVVRSIFDQLAGIQALITVGSTSAIDAMLCNVPIVTLERESRAKEADYVLCGATNHVRQHEVLAKRLIELLENGQQSTITTAAQNYLTKFYGTPDSKASQRVADNIAALANLKKNELGV